MTSFSNFTVYTDDDAEDITIPTDGNTTTRCTYYQLYLYLLHTSSLFTTLLFLYLLPTNCISTNNPVASLSSTPFHLYLATHCIFTYYPLYLYLLPIISLPSNPLYLYLLPHCISTYY